MEQEQTLGEFAQSYEPTQKTKNVADLPEISTDLKLVDDEFTFTNEKGVEETVKQKVVIVDDEKYVVKTSVINQLKVIMEDNPNLKKFKVKKAGTGMDTKYQVIPLA